MIENLKRTIARFVETCRETLFHLSDEVREDIESRNRSRFILCNMMGIAVFLPLTIISLFFSPIRPFLPVYGLMLSLLVLLFLTGRFLLARRMAGIDLLSQLLLALVLGFMIYLGTFDDPTMLSANFCVVLAVAPLLFISNPLKTLPLMIVATIAFCVCTSIAKEPLLASFDILNAAVFFLISSVVNFATQLLRLREMRQRHFIEHERDTDRITQLLNKNAFQLQTTRLLEHKDACGSMLILDLDDFKLLNDTYGHAYGDQVIAQVGQCILRSFRSTDIMSRFGGDEYLLFLPNVTDPSTLLKCIRRLQAALAQVPLPDGRRLEGSIGFSIVKNNEKTFAQIFEEADQMLYLEKQLKKKQKATLQPISE